MLCITVLDLTVHVLNIVDPFQLNDLTKGAIKCLVACTQHSPPAKTTIASYPSGNYFKHFAHLECMMKSVVVVLFPGLELLTGLLENADNAVVGNTALCLSHCTEHQGVSEALTKTDIIKQLLVLARDQTRYSVQQNCAVLIAKLCQGHPRWVDSPSETTVRFQPTDVLQMLPFVIHSHLERLRELHGIEILHDVLKKEKH